MGITCPNALSNSAVASKSETVNCAANATTTTTKPITTTTIAPTTTTMPVTTTTVPASGGSCTNPTFTTSAPFGGEQSGPYYMYNNEWNASGYQVTQTLNVCSYNNWDVVANMNNNSGDGAVKTYPCVQDNLPGNAISSYNSITSTFAETDPQVAGDIYEDAYDIWINGEGNGTELMIWTHNFGQTPGGSEVGQVTIGGASYSVWHGGGYNAYVANTNVTSGTLDLLAFMKDMESRGYTTASAPLDQINYGVELVSTGGTNQQFNFTNFSVSTS